MRTSGPIVVFGSTLREWVGFCCHMLNRANARARVFTKVGDYLAFEGILVEALEYVPGMRLLSYCRMPNHWPYGIEVWLERTAPDGTGRRFARVADLGRTLMNASEKGPAAFSPFFGPL